MKKLILFLFCIFASIYPLNALSAGGGIYVGDDSPETLFTGSASSHYLLLSSNGVVSAWGDNTYGQCGAEASDEMTEINYINFKSKIIKVVAGNGFSIALDENNTAWGWGNNLEFQLGISRPTNAGAPTQFSLPQKIADNIIDIAVGDGFSILLNENGEVLFSGLGNADTLNVINLPQIDNLASKIKLITANYNNIIAIDENNSVFYLKSDMQSTEIIELPNVDEVQTVVTGKEHIIIRCLNGENVEFYGFGDNSKYQLGVDNIEFTTEPVLSLSIPKEKEQYISEFAGEYCTIVNIWNNISFYDNINQYSWGTSTMFHDNNEDMIPDKQLSIYTPEESSVYYQLISIGKDKSIGFDFMTNDIMIFDNLQSCDRISVIEPCNEINTMYKYQYNALDYNDYKVNFIKLNKEAFSNENSKNKYLYWEFVNENQFRVKIKDFITNAGNTAISTITLGKDTTGENRNIGTYGPSIWNFDVRKDSFKTEVMNVNHGSEDGVEITVSVYVLRNREEVMLNIPSDISIFYEDPEEITENTKLGLYLYGLPEGVTAKVSDIDRNTFKITLSGNSYCDMDYDKNIKICYIRANNEQQKTYVGDYDLNEVSVTAKESIITGFVIKSSENTPETLTISSSLIKGKENNKTVDVSISGGTFNETLSSELWNVYGVDNVNINSVVRIDCNNVKLILSGNSKDKYTDAELRIICDSSQYSDSRIYDEHSGIYTQVDLISSNAIKIKKQNKSDFGSSGSSGNSMPAVIYNPGVQTTETVDNRIILTIGKKEASVFGETKTNDVAPIIRNDRTMLPARFVAEAMGAVVEWDNNTRTITITKDDTEIIITIDSETAIVNGETITLDSPAFIENDRTYTPLRFIAENLGGTVEWGADSQTVTIKKL